MPWDDDSNTSNNDGPWGSSGGGSSGGSGGGNRGPWGGGSQGGGPRGPRGPRGPGGPGRGGGGGDEPPDLEELLKRGQERLRTFFPEGGSGGGDGDGPQVALPGKRLIALLFLALIIGWGLTGFYRVNADEVGVVMRFGQYTNETRPGLNYHLPYPIETALTPKVTRVNRIDAGFRSLGDGSASNALRDVQEESLMLTGDENIVDIDFTVLWRISVASDYLFNLKEPELVVKAVAESVMREVIGRNKIQEILTERRDSVQSEVRTMMQEVLNEYGAGITVQEVQLRKVDPPQEVIESFRDVQAAQADAERMRNEADAYARDVVPRARGEAERMVQEAMGYKEKAVRTAEGEASRFLAVYNEYAQAKDVTRKRIYLETMEAIMGGMDKIILDSEGSGVLPYLPLNEMKKGAK